MATAARLPQRGASQVGQAARDGPGDERLGHESLGYRAALSRAIGGIVERWRPPSRLEPFAGRHLPRPKDPSARNLPTRVTAFRDFVIEAFDTWIAKSADSATA